MKLFLFVLFLFWLYHYWRFTGKRKYYKKMVIVAEHRHERLQTEQSALELASAYMQVQRYASAYNAFASVLMKYKYTPQSFLDDPVNTLPQFLATLQFLMMSQSLKLALLFFALVHIFVLKYL